MARVVKGWPSAASSEECDQALGEQFSKYTFGKRFALGARELRKHTVCVPQRFPKPLIVLECGGANHIPFEALESLVTNVAHIHQLTLMRPGWLLLVGEQALQGRDRDNLLRLCRQLRIDCDQGIGLQSRDRQVLRVPDGVPVELGRDPRSRAT